MNRKGLGPEIWRESGTIVVPAMMSPGGESDNGVHPQLVREVVQILRELPHPEAGCYNTSSGRTNAARKSAKMEGEPE